MGIQSVTPPGWPCLPAGRPKGLPGRCDNLRTIRSPHFPKQKNINFRTHSFDYRTFIAIFSSNSPNFILRKTTSKILHQLNTNNLFLSNNLRIYFRHPISSHFSSPLKQNPVTDQNLSYPITILILFFFRNSPFQTFSYF